jgi:hypothetical protein
MLLFLVRRNVTRVVKHSWGSKGEFLANFSSNNNLMGHYREGLASWKMTVGSSSNNKRLHEDVASLLQAPASSLEIEHLGK